VTQVAAAPSADTTSSLVAAFGDPNAMALRIRKDLRIDRSEHFAFNTDEITFRATLRAGAKIKAATGITVMKNAAS
jgi:HK97 family phage major capsid protein